MSMLRSPSALAAGSAGAQLAVAIAACQRAITPSRVLDGEIALAVFPALIELPRIEAGIWSQADGTRVRALRYSEACSAAATLVPPGFWIEKDGAHSIVAGAQGSWAGDHAHGAISLCIAALSARVAGAAHDR